MLVEKPSVVAYMRVSTGDQRERGTVATQLSCIERFCRRQGLNLADAYTDYAVSSLVPFHERPAGSHLLHDARRGRIQGVVLYAFDRLGRGEAIVLPAVSAILEQGITLGSVVEADIDVQTPEGWNALLAEVRFAVAEYERFLQRSHDGTERLVRAGAWVGGIVAFGYRVDKFVDQQNGELEKRSAGRLIVSNELIPELGMSEADVVRLIYDLCANKHWSCTQISDHLNALGVLPVYAREGRKVLRGRHKVGTAGIWRPGRIQHLIKNTTYKGIHQYAKRSTKTNSKAITRQVAAIVDSETWERAQQVVRDNAIDNFKKRKQQYLLRRLITCAHCGLTYHGTTLTEYCGERKVYYVCGGRANHRQLKRLGDSRCFGKAFRAERIEPAIWADIIGTMQNPEDMLGQLTARITADQRHIDQLREEATSLKHMYTRSADRALLQLATDRLEQAVAIEQQRSRVDRACSLLRNDKPFRFHQDVSFEVKREAIITLVENIVVETDEYAPGRSRAIVRVAFHSGATRTYFPTMR